MHEYKNLLDQVNSIIARYKKIDELTGENFNVFRILKLESSEVRMHSAFLAELLDPNGSHGQKDAFLKLFIKEFCFKKNEIDSVSCKVTVEENIGKMSEDKTRGVELISSSKTKEIIKSSSKIRYTQAIKTISLLDIIIIQIKQI
jgi:hypothetical protein